MHNNDIGRNYGSANRTALDAAVRAALTAGDLYIMDDLKDLEGSGLLIPSNL